MAARTVAPLLRSRLLDQRDIFWIALVAWLLLGLSGCADRTHQIVISVPEQRMVLLKDGVPQAIYPVSTSKFGLGDAQGSNGTPLGALEVAQKIGTGAPSGAVFKSREATGEVLAPDAPGRDPVVTRILWLRGLESGNARAHDRYIYIHGTPEERRIGTPASYGCVRMRSRDIVMLYDAVGNGARVFIRNQPLPLAAAPYLAPQTSVPSLPPATAQGTPPTVLIPISQGVPTNVNSSSKSL